MDSKDLLESSVSSVSVESGGLRNPCGPLLDAPPLVALFDFRVYQLEMPHHRFELLVAHVLLNGPDVDTGFQRMDGVPMTQRMTRYPEAGTAAGVGVEDFLA